MNKLNSILRIFIISCLIASFTSCVEILEKPQSTEVTIDMIFSNRQYTESNLYTVYNYLVPRGFPFENGNPSITTIRGEFPRSTFASISDEGENVRGASWGRYVNTKGYDPVAAGKNQEYDFRKVWPGIRAAYVIIDNVDKVPDSEISLSEKEQIKAECKTLVALSYMDMLVRFGGLPIIKSAFSTSATSLKVDRSSVKDVIDFIISSCDEAYDNLPESQNGALKGRVSKGVALAIKSRTLLFAASPFFNSSSSDMVLPYSNPELVCLESYDPERWRIAAEAAASVIEWAPKAGCSLITKNDIELNDEGKEDAMHNAYGHATSVPDNKEIILANKAADPNNSNHKGFNDGIFWKFGGAGRGLSITQTFARQFRSADGSDVDWTTYVFDNGTPQDNGDGTYGTAEELTHFVPFSDYENKMSNMEPRFYQCCWPAGRPAPNFSMSGNYANWPVAATGAKSQNGIRAAFPMVKFHYHYAGENMKDWIVFRLAEFYLNYAEAVNEYAGPNGKTNNCSLTAIDAVNIIRRRGGLRDLSPEETINKDVFREQIRRERAVELFAEGHRLFDCRRWKIADETFGQRLVGIKYVQDNYKEAKEYTHYFLFYMDPRVWNKSMYLSPFPQEEVDKGYLIQNPGY
jgi:SusD family.